MVINGWMIFTHPLLMDQWEKLLNQVEKLRQQNPADWASSPQAKLAEALRSLVLKIIPEDPSRAEYRQGNTLGEDRKHWFRAKFGNGRFRLFFRYHSKEKIIVFAWVNDEKSLRTYGSKTDAYAVFRKMLNNGNPPDDWNALLGAASTPSAIERLDQASPPSA